MSSKINEKEEFIKLRAQGCSYNEIAQTMGKAKQTLMDWGRELEEEIKNMRNAEHEALMQQYKLTREHRVKMMGEWIKKIQEELEGRSLKDVPTEKLMDMLMKYQAHIKEDADILSSTKFLSSKQITMQKNMKWD